MLLSYNNSFTPIQVVQHPMASVTNTGSINYPNRDYKIGGINSDVFFAFVDGGLVMNKSQNNGALNCTSTNTAPAFNSLILNDSIIATITVSNTTFYNYAPSVITKSVRPAISSSITCLTTTGINEILESKIDKFSLVQNGYAEYFINSTFTNINRVSVFDINGRLVKNYEGINAPQLKVSLNEQTNGIYILKVADIDGSEKAFKLLKL
jgi:hypothetical protein